MYKEHAVKALFSGKTCDLQSPGYSEMLSLKISKDTRITVFKKVMSILNIFRKY